jgi:hypothetical protein
MCGSPLMGVMPDGPARERFFRGPIEEVETNATRREGYDPDEERTQQTRCVFPDAAIDDDPLP